MKTKGDLVIVILTSLIVGAISVFVAILLEGLINANVPEPYGNIGIAIVFFFTSNFLIVAGFVSVRNKLDRHFDEISKRLDELESRKCENEAPEEYEDSRDSK